MRIPLDQPSPIAIRDEQDIKLLSFSLGKEGRQAHFYGMFHFALPSFFKDRERQVESHPDAVLLEEGLNASIPPHHELNEDQRVVAEYVEKTVKAHMRLMGEADQRTAFAPKNPTRRLADFDFKSFCSGGKLSVEEMQKALRSGALDEILSLDESDILKERVIYKKRLADDLMPQTLHPIQKLLALIRADHGERMMRCDDRNNILLRHIEQTWLDGKDSVIPWGIAHLAPVQKALQAQSWSYVPGSKAYTTFMRMD